ncbi:hypothetical protein [[Pseudomonas] boreopolis]|uniref:Uncharacterized protein n=1 Tax=Xanthomonas boreopolis TaxID=86183 RepID=A0A919F9K6_9XANT|nr:hypothetical protein GCM10009090_25340 [[Pseudomonas] boreopolis]
MAIRFDPLGRLALDQPRSIDLDFTMLAEIPAVLTVNTAGNAAAATYVPTPGGSGSSGLVINGGTASSAFAEVSLPEIDPTDLRAIAFSAEFLTPPTSETTPNIFIMELMGTGAGFGHGRYTSGSLSAWFKAVDGVGPRYVETYTDRIQARRRYKLGLIADLESTDLYSFDGEIRDFQIADLWPAAGFAQAPYTAKLRLQNNTSGADSQITLKKIALHWWEK